MRGVISCKSGMANATTMNTSTPYVQADMYSRPPKRTRLLPPSEAAVEADNDSSASAATIAFAEESIGRVEFDGSRPASVAATRRFLRASTAAVTAAQQRLEAALQSNHSTSRAGYVYPGPHRLIQ